MSLPIPEEKDSNLVIVLKLLITVVTVVIIAFTSVGEGIKILRYRNRKSPQMGFTKEME